MCVSPKCIQFTLCVLVFESHCLKLPESECHSNSTISRTTKSRAFRANSFFLEKCSKIPNLNFCVGFFSEKQLSKTKFNQRGIYGVLLRTMLLEQYSTGCKLVKHWNKMPHVATEKWCFLIPENWVAQTWWLFRKLGWKQVFLLESLNMRSTEIFSNARALFLVSFRPIFLLIILYCKKICHCFKEIFFLRLS